MTIGPHWCEARLVTLDGDLVEYDEAPAECRASWFHFRRDDRSPLDTRSQLLKRAKGQRSRVMRTDSHQMIGYGRQTGGFDLVEEGADGFIRAGNEGVGLGEIV